MNGLLLARAHVDGADPAEGRDADVELLTEGLELGQGLLDAQVEPGQQRGHIRNRIG